MPPLRLDPLTARRFMRRALLLDSPAPDIATALTHHGYVQIDPINVCGRMHDLILRNRVAGYAEGGIMRHLHGDNRALPAAQRTAFEHHIPSAGILVAFTNDAWPHLLAAMRVDKKTRGARLRFVVLNALAHPSIVEAPADEELASAYQEVAS